MDPEARKAMRREALRVDVLYYHVYFARNHSEYDYGRIFRSNREKDEKEIREAYNKILSILDELGPKGDRVRGWKAVLLSRLAELESNYEEKLKIIDQAITELESSFLEGEYLYEYIDLCLRKGNCLVERREKPEVIEKHYNKADRAIQMSNVSRVFPKSFGGINQEMQLQILPDWRHLRCKFYMAVASFRLDAYDREPENKKPVLQLVEAKRYLIRAEALLKKIRQDNRGQVKDTQIEKANSQVSANDSKDGKKTSPGFNIDCLGEGSLRFSPETGRFDRDKVVNLTYLSTRGFYHLKERERGGSQWLDEVLDALELYLAGFLYDLRNTISMDNIAYICYLFAYNLNFQRKLQERVGIRRFYEEFPGRLKMELRSRLALNIVCSVLEEVTEEIKRVIWKEILKTNDDFEREEIASPEIRLPAELIRDLWQGSQQVSVLNAMMVRLVYMDNKSADGNPDVKDVVGKSWEDLFDRLFPSRSLDGFQPRPLLPRGIRPVDQMAEDNRDAIRQIVKGKMDKCWKELEESAEPEGTLVTLSEKSGNQYVWSGYSVLLGGSVGNAVQVAVERAESTSFIMEDETFSANRDKSYRDKWPLLFNEKAGEKIMEKVGGICEDVCWTVRPAREETSSAYDLLDWIFTVSRGGLEDGNKY